MSTLAGTACHDLNNLLASVQTNAFLLEGRVVNEDAAVLSGIAAAVELGGAIPEHLAQLRGGPRRQPPPVTLRAVSSQVQLLLQQWHGDQGRSSVTLSEDAGDLLLDATQVEVGFSALVAFALALLPERSKLEIRLSRGAANGGKLSVRLQDARVPSFLMEPDQEASIGDLLLPRLVGWLARRQGGDLRVERDPHGALDLELWLREDESVARYVGAQELQ